MHKVRPVTVIVRLFGVLTVLAAGLAVLTFVSGAGKLPGGPYVPSTPDRPDSINVARLERAFSSSGRERQADVSFFGFRQEGDRDYLVVAADSRQGPVYLHLRVLDWDEPLRQLRDTGGNRHARLQGLRWDGAVLGKRRELIYRGFERVID